MREVRTLVKPTVGRVVCVLTAVTANVDVSSHWPVYSLPRWWSVSKMLSMYALPPETPRRPSSVERSKTMRITSPPDHAVLKLS